MKFLILVFLILSSFSNEVETTTITITVTNIKTLKGNIDIGLYNNGPSFPEKDMEFKTYSQTVTNDSLVFVLEDLEKADYAIALYHDINLDDECNLNFFGIPVEPYGFSKNFRPLLTAPSFDDCKISVDKEVSIMIELID